MKRPLLIATLALVLGPLWAQDASSDFDSLAAPADGVSASADDVTVPADLGSFQWSGDQEFAWRQAAAENPTHDGAQVDGKLSGAYKWHELKLVAGAQVRDNEFVPGESALFWSPGVFKFGLGLQEFSWGVADKKNPTDTLNARDYRNNLDAPRLVNPAATAAWYPAEWVSVEAVYEPWKLESRYPTDFQRTTQAGLTAQAAKL